MRIIRFGEDNVAINIDRIDGISYDTINHRTTVYVGGADKPFFIAKPLDEVLQIINNYENLEMFGERVKKGGD